MPEPVAVGHHGIQLKHFEQVVAKLLSKIQPTYVQLPSPPFQMPLKCGVQGDGETGKIANPVRAQRKEDQIRSMIRCILSLLPPHLLREEASTTTTTYTKYTIVDFGGGSGHLVIPLAMLLPHIRIVCVDLSERALKLLHQKVNSFSSASDGEGLVELKACQLQATALENLLTFHGPVQAYTGMLDMAVALHLCGEATDVALRIAGQASALVVCPCCVGKLAGDGDNPYVFQATGKNVATVSYPQSSIFCQLILGTAASTATKYKKEVNAAAKSEDDSILLVNGNQSRLMSDWDVLAKSADYSSMPETRTPRNAARRTAKALLETDRRLFLEETFGFSTCLTRMKPWEASPKNDILLAWKPGETIQTPYHPSKMNADPQCEQDILRTATHLLTQTPSDSNEIAGDRIDWTQEEEQEIRQKIKDFFVDCDCSQYDDVLVFPSRMGGRTRKLIHFVAEQMGLAHWSHGTKSDKKTVAVARVRRKI